MGYAGFKKYILVFKCINNVIIKMIHYYIADTLRRYTLCARECGGKTNMDLKVLKTMNVIIAEDDAMAASFLARALQQFFNTIHVVSDGKKALEHMQTHTVNLLITDLAMPHFSGIKLIEAIRKQEQMMLHKQVPIIVISGRQEPKELIEIIQHQVVDYLIKPISLSRLYESFDRLCVKLLTEDALLYTIDATMRYCTSTKSLLEGNVVMPLTPNEALLMEILLENRSRLLSKTILIEKIYSHDIEESRFRNLLARFRKKLGKHRLINHKELGIKLA
jgi:DNA-binding response OmpR family regulator